LTIRVQILAKDFLCRLDCKVGDFGAQAVESTLFLTLDFSLSRFLQLLDLGTGLVYFLAAQTLGFFAGLAQNALSLGLGFTTGLRIVGLELFCFGQRFLSLLHGFADGGLSLRERRRDGTPCELSQENEENAKCDADPDNESEIRCKEACCE
jgi:hypothetical protein